MVYVHKQLTLVPILHSSLEITKSALKRSEEGRAWSSHRSDAFVWVYAHLLNLCDLTTALLQSWDIW